MRDLQVQRPGLALEDVIRLAADRYGLEVRGHPLDSERDQNVLLTDEQGTRYVFKVANGAESAQALEFEHAVLDRLHTAAPPLPVPTVVPTLDGEAIFEVREAGEVHLARLMAYLPGRVLADFPSRPPALLRQIGSVMGRLDRCLDGFDHPGARRPLVWDLARLPDTASTYLEAIDEEEARELVRAVVEDFERHVAPLLPHLRHGVIHNDANDHNVLVGGGPAPAVVGLIDFGDMTWSALVNEPAVAAAYALLGQPDPLSVIAQVVAGYHEQAPLTEEELPLLPTLVRGRLAISVMMSAFQARPERSAYLGISEGPAWQALERLARLNRDLVHYRLRAACGLPPCPASVAVTDWLGTAPPVSPVLPGVDVEGAVVLDLSPGSPDIDRLDQLTDPDLWQEKIARRMEEAGATAALGRYDEPRLCYTGEQFSTPDGGWRTIHMGQDVFAPAGSPVHAPIAGTVHSVRHNDLPLDYGPTVVLEHCPAEGLRCFTLFGHLDRDALALQPGTAVAAGDQIGRLGDVHENGGWPPHLHFQIITDLVGHEGNFPGVASPDERELWRALSPDPSALLGTRGASGPARTDGGDMWRAARVEHVGTSLSLSYADPLPIVRGWGAYLYDDAGRPYLDCVNNVCHVGHGHPDVVAAATRQMAVLNTNTRYLHPNLAEYAGRLTALFPDPLSVCFLVNSGSEANELALRLARAHTDATDIVVLDHAYHGNTGALVDLSPYKHAGPGGMGAPDWVHVVPLPDPYRGPHQGPEAGSRTAAAVRDALGAAAGRGRAVAAFLAESASSCGGQVLLADGYLAAAYAHAREGGAVCIADEVQVGFGRAGSHMWMFETQGVVPDIVTLGKPIGNGHPLGAVITTPAIAASFDNGMEYFNTFGGNPVSCAVGLAVLDVIENEGLQEHAGEVGGVLLDGLRALQERHSVIGDVRGRGLFIGVELVRDRGTKEPADREATYVVERLKDEGILVSIDGPLHNVLKIKPPLAFSQPHAHRLAGALDRVLSEVAW